MHELPRRETELEVRVEGGAVRLYVEPMTDEQYFRVAEAAVTRGGGEGERFVFRASAVPGLFESQLRRVEGVEVDGLPFDAANADHVARIPQPWKAIANARLLRYAMGLTEEELGNSPGRPAPPPAASNPAD